jgi:tRNA/rRNA methyltransferase
MKTKDSIKKHSLQPTVILVEPQMGENIGAAARAMWNFGLERLRIVNPRDGWPNQKAVVMASGAGRLLDEASIYNTTNESIADLTYVFATTARVRGLNKNVITPLQAMKKTRNLIEGGERVGLLFGPERAGLSNDDTALARDIISIPVNPSFPSLNLAQSVLLNAYEWRNGGRDPISNIDQPKLAKSLDIKILTDAYEKELSEKGFFWPEEKASSMRLHLKSLFSRLLLSEADVRILHGVRKSLTRIKRARD